MHYRPRRASASRRTPTIDEENDMWSKIAIIENNIDQMEDGWKAQDKPEKIVTNIIFRFYLSLMISPQYLSTMAYHCDA